jgi:hypothetical protein
LVLSLVLSVQKVLVMVADIQRRGLMVKTACTVEWMARTESLAFQTPHSPRTEDQEALGMEFGLLQLELRAASKLASAMTPAVVQLVVSLTEESPVLGSKDQ